MLSRRSVRSGSRRDRRRSSAACRAGRPPSAGVTPALLEARRAARRSRRRRVPGAPSSRDGSRRRRRGAPARRRRRTSGRRGREQRRLREHVEAEEVAVEGVGVVFPPGGHGELDVVEARDPPFHRANARWATSSHTWIEYSAYQSARPCAWAARWRGSSRQASWAARRREHNERHALAVVRHEGLEVDETGHLARAYRSISSAVRPVLVPRVGAQARPEHRDHRAVVGIGGHAVPASRNASFQVRKRWWTTPSGPSPSPLPSGNTRNVHVLPRSSAQSAR